MTQKEYGRDYQKEDNENINSKDFIIGALIGGMVGAATALFLAPKSGRELRSDLNEQAKVLSEKTEKIRQTAMEKGSDLAVTAKAKSGTVTELVTNKSTDIVNKVKSMTANGGGTAKGTEDTESTEADREVTSVETSNTGDNTAKLKLDETKKAFEETENRYKQ